MTFDYVIVGAGFCGSTSAERLTRKYYNMDHVTAQALALYHKLAGGATRAAATVRKARPDQAVSAALANDTQHEPWPGAQPVS